MIECIRRSGELILGTETVDTAQTRFGSAIDQLMASGRNHDQNVAIVSHGTVISAFIAERLKIDPIPVWEYLGLPGLVEIDWPNPSKITNRQNFD